VEQSSEASKRESVQLPS
jgi:hypothetical protein